MTDPIFCCSRIEPHKPTKTADDPKFNAFRNAAMNNDIRTLSHSQKNSSATTATFSTSKSYDSSGPALNNGNGSGPNSNSSSDRDMDITFAPNKSTLLTSPPPPVQPISKHSNNSNSNSHSNYNNANNHKDSLSSTSPVHPISKNSNNYNSNSTNHNLTSPSSRTNQKYLSPFPSNSDPSGDETDDLLSETPYLIQVIRRFDIANIEWVRYFANSRSDAGGRRGGWMEVKGSKVGGEWSSGESFKNYGCKYHYRLFEVNVFERRG